MEPHWQKESSGDFGTDLLVSNVSGDTLQDR